MMENPITQREPGTCLLVLSVDLDLGALISQTELTIQVQPLHT
jgi:hypothetical protein